MFFKNRKFEIRIVKDNLNDSMEMSMPTVTKEDVIKTTKTIVRYVAGAVLVTMAAAAVLDTAQYSAMTKIDNKYPKKELEN